MSKGRKHTFAIGKTRKAVRWAVASTKMTNYFVTAGSKCEDEITAAEGALLHFTLLSIIIAFC